MKQVSQAPQRPSAINPAGLAGARRGRDAGAGEGPGATLPGRRRLHRRPRRGRGGARRSAPVGDTARFAAGRRRRRTEPPPEEREEQQRRWRWILVAIAVLARRARRPGADPRHDQVDGPERDRRAAEATRARRSSRPGFEVDDRATSSRSSRAGTGPRAGPDGRRSEADEGFLTVDAATVSAGPGERQGPRRRRRARTRGRQGARERGLRGRHRGALLDPTSRRAMVIGTEPDGGRSVDGGLDR